MKKELKKWIAYDAEFGEEAGDTFYDVQLFRIRRGLDDSFYLMHET